MMILMVRTIATIVKHALLSVTE